MLVLSTKTSSENRPPISALLMTAIAFSRQKFVVVEDRIVPKLVKEITFYARNLVQSCFDRDTCCINTTLITLCGSLWIITNHCESNYVDVLNILSSWINSSSRECRIPYIWYPTNDYRSKNEIPESQLLFSMISMNLNVVKWSNVMMVNSSSNTRGNVHFI